MTSRHLESRIIQHYGGVHLHVVFIDIVGYHKRKPPMQYEVMRSFTQLINTSLQRLTQSCASRVPLDVNEVESSILKVPTAEGAAVAFTFEDWPTAAHEFVQTLADAHRSHRPAACSHFENQKWCDCHAAFHITTEIQQGDGFVYRDLNNAYSVAGSTLDFARRSRNELVSTNPGRPPARPPVLHLEL